MPRIVGQDPFGPVLGQADDLIGVLAVAHFHAGRADRHAGHRCASEVRLGTQLEDVGCRHVAFDELATDHGGMAGAEPGRHAMGNLHRAHVGRDAGGHAEAVGLEVLDPVLAAAAVGVAMDVDGDRLGGLRQAGKESGGKQ